MFVLIVLNFAVLVNGQFAFNKHECSPVIIPMCLEMPYNATKMPNLLQHRTQEEAAITAHEFLPLVDIKCSPFVRFFICSVFAPMCTDKISYGLTSCRIVCTVVKDGCLPVLENLNFTWPQFLVCESFPEQGLCMTPPNLKNYVKERINQPGVNPAFPAYSQGPNSVWGSTKKLIPFVTQDRNPDNNNNWCSGPRIWIQTDSNDGFCAPLCGKDFLFSAKDKKIAVAWASSWALVSILSTSFSLLTFGLNKKRFGYPERPVICLALSYFFYSSPFLLRALFSTESLSCEVDPATGKTHLASSGISSPGCIITFLLQYYFGLASYLWWTILTFCWYMTACKRWASEGLRNFSSYFHGIAWGLPALGSVIAIALKQVTGDELLGMCFIGAIEPWAQLYLVIFPQASLVSLGTIFIVLGFVSLFRIRNDIKKEFFRNQFSVPSPSTSLTTIPPSSSPSSAPNTSPSIHTAAHVGKLERLMIRLGVFSVLSTVPAIFVLGCHLHAYFNHQFWAKEAALASTSCETGWNAQGCGPRRSHPPVETELLKIFMSLIIGVTAGIWVWSHKTISLWKKFFLRLFRLQDSSNLMKSGANTRNPNLQPTQIGEVSRGYINLQESCIPFMGDNRHSHQRGLSPRSFSPVNPEMNFTKGRTSSEFSTSFV